MDRWNPFSSKIPHTSFLSHLLVRRKKVSGRRHMEIDGFITELEKAVQDYRRTHGNVSNGLGGDVCWKVPLKRPT